MPAKGSAFRHRRRAHCRGPSVGEVEHDPLELVPVAGGIPATRRPKNWDQLAIVGSLSNTEIAAFNTPEQATVQFLGGVALCGKIMVDLREDAFGVLVVVP